MKKNRYLIIGLLILFSLTVAACSPQAESRSYELALAADLPQEIQTAPASVRQSYQFAVANPEILKEIPCYCGCGAMGHTSNYACYIQDDSTQNNLVFDGHALGCSICVDITIDVMDMLDKGHSLDEIQAEIDAVYSAFGPSNMP